MALFGFSKPIINKKLPSSIAVLPTVTLESRNMYFNILVGHWIPLTFDSTSIQQWGQAVV